MPIDLAELEAAVDIGTDAAEEVLKPPSAPSGASNLHKQVGAYIATIPGTTKGNRDNEAFRVGAKLMRDFNLSSTEAWPFMQQWNLRNDPPLSDEELREAMMNGDKYGKGEKGKLLNTTKHRTSTSTKGNNAVDAKPSEQSVLKITCCADIQPRETEWLIPEILPLGCITSVVAQEGAGKSTLTAYWTADVSNGSGDVVLFNHEEHPNCDIVPRLIANNANMQRVHLVEGILTQDGEDVFDIEQNISLLYQLTEKLPDLKLAIFDPAPSFVSCNENSNQEVRRALKMLVDFSAAHNVAVLTLSHLNKKVDLGMINRTIGSRAWSAVPRLSWGIQVEQIENEDGTKTDTDGRFLLCIKCNIGKKPQGFRFVISEGGRVIVDAERIDRSIDEVGGIQSSRKDEIGEWLIKRLGNDSIPQETLAKEALQYWNIKASRLGKIANQNGIKKRFSAVENCWVWSVKK